MSTEGTPQTYWQRAIEQALSGLPEQAMRLRDRALSIDHARSLASWQQHMLNGLIDLRVGNAAAGEQRLRAAAADPAGSEAIRSLIASLDRTQLPAAAKDVLRRSLKSSPRPSRVRPSRPAGRPGAGKRAAAIGAGLAIVCLLVGVLIWQPGVLSLGTSGAKGLDNARVDAHVGLVVTQVKIRLADQTERTIIWNSGSAFAVSKDGLMLTNHHVVAPDKFGGPGDRLHLFETYNVNGFTFTPIEFLVAVRFDSDVWHAAEIVAVGEGEHQDVAVLRVKDVNFPAPFVVVKDASRGDSVLACGFPGLTMGLSKEFNRSQSDEASRQQFLLRTEGREDPSVSYPARTIVMSTNSGNITSIIPTNLGRTYVTDAFIHSGNSGGPLLNQKGEVVGIVTARHKESESVNIAYSAYDLLTVLAMKHPELSSLVPSR